MNPAESKIVAIFLDILLYELGHGSDGMLLSEQLDRWIEDHPVWARAVIVGLGAVITGHLANVVPEAVDLLAKNFWRRIFQ